MLQELCAAADVEFAVMVRLSLISQSLVVADGISTELLTAVVDCPLFRVVVQSEGAMEFPEFIDSVILM